MQDTHTNWGTDSEQKIRCKNTFGWVGGWQRFLNIEIYLSDIYNKFIQNVNGQHGISSVDIRLYYKSCIN